MYLSGVSRMDWHVKEGLKEKEQRSTLHWVGGPNGRKLEEEEEAGMHMATSIYFLKV